MSAFRNAAALQDWRAAAVDLPRIADELRENQEQLAEAQRIANVGSWELDLATGRRTFSDQFCRIFSLVPGARPRLAQLYGLIHREDRKTALRVEKMARETMQPVVEQFRLVLPATPLRTVVARARVIVDDCGVPLRIIGVVQDVSERVAYEEELRHVAVQQAAVANFGQIALSGASLEFLFNQVKALLRNVVDADVEIVAGTDASVQTNGGSITVPIASADERPWGILAVRSRTRRAFNGTDCDFLRSVAAVLAQAIERARADAELRLRTLQQSAIAELGRATLTKLDDAAIARACELVARGLGIEGVDFACGAFVVPVTRTLTAEEADYVEAMTNILAEAMEREEARAAAQQTTRQLQLVLESTLEGICTVDALGRCTMANPATARMFGRTVEELLGRDMHELVHSRRADGSPYPKHDCPVSRVVAESAPQTVINDLFWRADGTPMPVDYSAAPIVDGDVTVGAVVAITDASARRKLELNLEQANRVSGLGRLAATVAHEFNNVLMGISPFVEVIRRKPERTDGALDQIAAAIARGKRITAEILRFTRPAELARTAFFVEPWLRDLATHVRPLLSDHRVTIDVADPALRVDADRAQLEQVFTNLVVNARDAMPDGGVIAITAQCEPPDARFAFAFLADPERFIHFTVADSGVGMSDETLRHIFEPLFTTKGSGTGLGLAVAHQVVQRHGGEIFAESAAGAGATFHLFIPIAEGAGESPSPLPSPPVHAVAPARYLLLVDDDDVVVAGLVALLELEGMRVDAVGTGADALAMLRRKRPDVVLLDVGLPDMDGTEVYARIAEMHPELPVVFSTGHADTARLEELEHGHVVSLLKPYDLGTLLDAIDRAIGRSSC